MATTIINVAIIEDQRSIREGLAWLIDSTPGYHCAGSYASMETALAKIDAAIPDVTLPDVVLMDIGLPGMNGIEGVRELKRRYPKLLALMLTIYDDDERIFEAMCAGACGYLLKKTPPARLLESIQEVIEGGAPMSPSIARRIVTLFSQIAPPAHADYHLTPHETRLLKMLVEGHSYKTAAAELGLSINTVSFHMRNVYDKLQVHSKSEAVAKALRERLV